MQARKEVVALIADLLETGSFAPAGRGEQADRIPAQARIMLTAEKRVPQLDGLATAIKVLLHSSHQ